MTQVFNDNIQVDMQIDGDEWLLAEAEVKLSYHSEANYTKIPKMTPGPEASFDKVEDLVGTDFSLEVDNDLDVERDGADGADVTLFEGKLANISPRGAKDFEGIAYDPSQQAFGSGQKGTNMANQTVRIGYPYYGSLFLYNVIEGTRKEPKTIRADELATKIVNQIPTIEDYEIQLTEGGVTRSGRNGETEGAYNPKLTFDKLEVSVGQALKKIREECKADWWFDKTGKFYIGMPESTPWELRYITDTSAGITTPPYQSVKVIGSGVASDEGFPKSDLRPEERVTIEAAIGQSPNGEFYPVTNKSSEPQFIYRNNELSTQQQAETTAIKLIEDLIEQQKEGEITVVGFPQVSPIDALIMPHNNPDSDAPNYQEGMPMGGERYGVYSVTHRLNGTDGFITKLEVGGPMNLTRIQLPAKDKPDSSDGDSENEEEAAQSNPDAETGRVTQSGDVNALMAEGENTGGTSDESDESDEDDGDGGLFDAITDFFAPNDSEE